jgi:hypothetical protein
MPHFDMLRAAFWLLAAMIIAQVVVTLAGGGVCFWLFVRLIQPLPVGSCSGFLGQVREMWAEALAAVLALLLASRGGGPGPPPPPEEPPL